MTSVLFTCLPDTGKLSWGGRDRHVLVALHQDYRAEILQIFCDGFLEKLRQQKVILKLSDLYSLEFDICHQEDFRL